MPSNVPATGSDKFVLGRGVYWEGGMRVAIAFARVLGPIGRCHAFPSDVDGTADDDGRWHVVCEKPVLISTSRENER